MGREVEGEGEGEGGDGGLNEENCLFCNAGEKKKKKIGS